MPDDLTLRHLMVVRRDIEDCFVWSNRWAIKLHALGLSDTKDYIIKVLSLVAPRNQNSQLNTVLYYLRVVTVVILVDL